MKTFNYSIQEKAAIVKYLLKHRMSRKINYDDTKWEKIKKQRIRARKPVKAFLDPNYYNDEKCLNTLNFDCLYKSPRIGVDEECNVIHNPVSEVDLNEEITNLLRRLLKEHAKYAW